MTSARPTGAPARHVAGCRVEPFADAARLPTLERPERFNRLLAELPAAS